MYPVYLIMTTGRTGSDYLQGCLDNLKGVITFCGKFEYHNFFKNYQDLENKEVLIDNFIKKNKSIFFYNKIEDVNTNVNVKILKKNFLYLTKNIKINRANFLINIYKAYHLAVGRKLKKIKALVHHSHGIENTKKCLEDFPNAKLFITIRDPRANLKSGLENWFNYDKKRRSMMHFYLYLKRIREDLRFALNINNSKIFLKLEDAGKISTKKKICKFLKIKYDNNINFCTFNNIPWRGDSLSSTKSKKGEFNKNILNNGWNNFFSKSDIKVLDFLYKDYIKFGYKISKSNFFQKVCSIILILNFSTFKIFKKKTNYKIFIENLFYFFKSKFYMLKTIVFSS